MAEMTPLMRQFWEMKSQHQDKVLLFRMGDFYEMFFDDAVKAAPILGIALTSRNKKAADETPMCGVPHHSISGPINKLLAHGLKVAICDQIEDPKFAKGIVKRAVTRVLTPGMVLDAETLETTRAHYVACAENGVLACIDATTGESFFFADLANEEALELAALLPIAEWVVAPGAVVSQKSETAVVSEHARLAGPCPELLAAEGFSAPARLLSYLQSLSGDLSALILRPFERRRRGGRMALSQLVIRHLEIFQTYRGDERYSLFHAINRTQTSIGARLLRQWLCFPLLNEGEIRERQDRIGHWSSDLGRLQGLRSILRGMGDLERRLTKIGQPACGPRDLLSLRDTLRAGLAACELAHPGTEAQWQKLASLAAEIERILRDDAPVSAKQGHLIRDGYSPELDEVILLATDSHSLIEKMEAREREATGIPSLKIRYNQVFGYYIEVTHTHRDKAPAHYLRKQTLANAERYCTEELLELEKKVLSAQTRRCDMECEIFESLRKQVLSLTAEALELAATCAQLDVETSLAWLANERKFVRPELSPNRELHLVASRHPVVEQVVKEFVANDIKLEAGGCLLLTGPNMAGKSTIMRQVALTALLTQIGSFVPATKAIVPLFDQIFTRIGASDQLSEGLSTFMVEMTETAEILNRMSARSLVIFDEIGRGTSTFDGMSLAQSILEYLLHKKRATTLFATHYHELTQLHSPHLHNAHMSVVEKNGEIRFLHTLTGGPALKSYGIQVARLAGLPSEVTKRAAEVLKKRGDPSVNDHQLTLFEAAVASLPAESAIEPASPEVPKSWQQVAAGIREFPLQKRTPLEALNQIAQWQDMISSPSSDLNH